MILDQTTNDQLMAIAMHRYCLGRASYIVSSCIESLQQVWTMLDGNTQAVILRDTREAIARDEAEMSMDKREWQRFVEWTDRQRGLG